MDFTELKKRFDEAKAYKDRWLALYSELYRYVIPDRDAFNIKFNYEDIGKPTTNAIWDDTAVLAAYQRANDLHGLLLPSDRQWGKVALDPNKLPEDAMTDEAKEFVDELNTKAFYYLNQSNLSRVVSSSNLDLVGGTGAIWVESIDENTPLYFRSIPAVALYIEYSTDDVVNNCWYTAKMSGRQVLKFFPDYNGKIKGRLEGNPESTYAVNYGQLKENEDQYYIYAVLEDDPFTPLFEIERPYPQIIIYRDRVRPGECEGRGVGLDLLPTIRDLNRIMKYSRQNMAFKANPPLFYDTGNYFNPAVINQWAGALIARRPEGRNPLEALEMPEYTDVLNHIQDLRMVIKDGFQVDPLGDVDGPNKSATEVSIRENRAQRTSATDISRLINELPKQIFDVALKILNSWGLLSHNKEAIPGLSLKHLRFDFSSPLFDIQKQQNMSNLVNKFQLMQQFYGEGSILMSSDIQETLNYIDENLNIPRKLTVSNSMLMQRIQQFAQQMQAAQQPSQGGGAPGVPQPMTAAAPVSLPSSQGVTI